MIYSLAIIGAAVIMVLVGLGANSLANKLENKNIEKEETN